MVPMGFLDQDRGHGASSLGKSMNMNFNRAQRLGIELDDSCFYEFHE
jgi:hypothetical protein